MSYSVYLPDSFKRSLKRLTRRFPRVRQDVSAAIEEILRVPSLGIVIPGSGGVRKLRVRSTDLERGKSGGFRLLYIVLPDRELICPLLIYAKSDWEDVTRRELRALLADLKRELALMA
ncbi:MAG: type II toxin-antitoxin system RelE/ParE family toxin [Chloroflexi bacterium]|nr:MAG: type II toxin-antitoxin system RelE/ParE family toxin [Chloroflexota bacterium]